MFGAAAAEFVLWPKFGTSTYFLLTALALVDFLSGLALRTASRRGGGSRTCGFQEERQTGRAAGRLSRNSSLRRRSAGRGLGCRVRAARINPSRRCATRGRANAASPEVASPGLQPGSGAHAIAGHAAALIVVPIKIDLIR